MNALAYRYRVDRPSKQALMLLHAENLSEHGGIFGVRAESLLEAALAKPFAPPAEGESDEKPDIAALAAAYGRGLAQNQPFVGGNSRAAFLAVGLFLALNGYRLDASQLDAMRAIRALTQGEMSEADFASWLRTNMAIR